MPPYPAPPPPSFPPIPHTAPTYPINLPPISSQFSNAAQGHYQATQDPRSNHARDCLNHGSMGLEGTLQDCLIGQMEGLGLGLTDHMKSLYTQVSCRNQIRDQRGSIKLILLGARSFAISSFQSGIRSSLSAELLSSEYDDRSSSTTASSPCTCSFSHLMKDYLF